MHFHAAKVPASWSVARGVSRGLREFYDALEKVATTIFLVELVIGCLYWGRALHAAHC